MNEHINVKEPKQPSSKAALAKLMIDTHNHHKIKIVYVNSDKAQTLTEGSSS